jgi:hypothetical protein
MWIPRVIPPEINKQDLFHFALIPSAVNGLPFPIANPRELIGPTASGEVM